MFSSDGEKRSKNEEIKDRKRNKIGIGIESKVTQVEQNIQESA